jgi:hypothetical protein
MNSPYIESLFLNLVSKRNEAMANFHFLSSSRPIPSEIDLIPTKLDRNLTSIAVLNSKIDVLTKLFPNLSNLISENNQSAKEESQQEDPKSSFEPKGSDIYEDGELIREPSGDQ